MDNHNAVGNPVASWPQVCQQLVDKGLLAAPALEQVNVIWAFGKLIANTDMHQGNLFVDKNENIWIGTRNTGLYQFDGKSFTNFSE